MPSPRSSPTRRRNDVRIDLVRVPDANRLGEVGGIMKEIIGRDLGL
jgi:alkylation response protein AidB-like acyl-CoA dehydrogenase